LPRQQGLTEEQIAELWRYRESTILTPREKAAVWYADVLAGERTQASEALFDELRRYFSETEIIDLGFRITAFVGYGRLIRALGLEKGGTCPLPGEPHDIPQQAENT
jgi:alkylhydroperoxidase family enzyme